MTHTISIYVEIWSDDAWEAVGDTCRGAGKYADIAEGAEVDINDDSGRRVWTTTLDSGVAQGDGTCTWMLLEDGVPDAASYTLQIEGWGGQPYAREELEENGWEMLAIFFGDE